MCHAGLVCIHAVFGIFVSGVLILQERFAVCLILCHWSLVSFQRSLFLASEPAAKITRPTCFVEVSRSHWQLLKSVAPKTSKNHKT